MKAYLLSRSHTLSAFVIVILILSIPSVTLAIGGDGILSDLVGDDGGDGFVGDPGGDTGGDSNVTKGENALLGPASERIGSSGDIPTEGKITDYIINIIQFLLGLIGVLALGALVWAGIMYVMSLGDESRTSKAKLIILYAIIGIVVAAVSFIILSTIESFFT